MEFTNEEKRQLIKIARISIEAELRGEIKTTQTNVKEFPLLNSKCGAFVTLTISKQLRGCIGYITSDLPLIETIQEAAFGAAFRDPRFDPLTKTEYEQVELEISVLSEPFPMKSYDEIEIGKHGLILEEHGRRGLLLPQVPIEHGMNREQFLDAICRKTGILQELWRNKVLNISLFTATVFSEKELELEDGND